MSSLASATSTRVDSASKHIQACKVNHQFMKVLVAGSCDNPDMELKGNKMKYCMHKDELVMGLGKNIITNGNSLVMEKRAYPSVITNLGRIDPFVKEVVMLSYFAKNRQERTDFLNAALEAIDTKTPTSNTKKKQLQCFMDLYVVGVSLGLAYAHADSGDTVASVMVGGLRTVRNGAFPAHANDQLMAYIDGEEKYFDENGYRKWPDNNTMNDLFGFIIEDYSNGNKAAIPDYMKELTDMGKALNGPQGTLHDGQLKTYSEKQNGNFASDNPQKTHIFRIKPLMCTEGIRYPFDLARVFGRAIGNARPYEMLDLQLSRQSI